VAHKGHSLTQKKVDKPFRFDQTQRTVGGAALDNPAARNHVEGTTKNTNDTKRLGRGGSVDYPLPFRAFRVFRGQTTGQGATKRRKSGGLAHKEHILTQKKVDKPFRFDQTQRTVEDGLRRWIRVSLYSF